MITNNMMMQGVTTPEQIEANKAASAAKKGPKKMALNNTALVASFRQIGGRIIHIRPTKNLRGFTVAYIDKGTRVEFATAVQHSADTFDKKTGTMLAVSRVLSSESVSLPKSSKSRAGDIFRQLSWVLS